MKSFNLRMLLIKYDTFENQNVGIKWHNQKHDCSCHSFKSNFYSTLFVFNDAKLKLSISMHKQWMYFPIVSYKSLFSQSNIAGVNVACLYFSHIVNPLSQGW